jgi:hypothetical protein
MDNNTNHQLQEALASASQLELRLSELGKSLTILTGGQGELGKIFREFSKNIEESTTSLKKIEEVLKRANLQFDSNAAVLNLTNGSMRQNKAVLNGLLEQYELLSKEQGDHTKGLQALNLKIGELSNTIETQENKLTKNRKVFDAHKVSIDYLRTSMDTLGSKAGELGPEFSDMLTDVSGGFNAMKSGLSAVKTGFSGVGAALKTTGFGLLVIVLQSIVEYFTSTKEGADKFKKILAAVTTTINIVKETVGKFGGVLVNAFLQPVNTIKSVWDGFIENFTNRFKAIGVIMGAFSGGFNPKKLADGLIQLTTGVSNATSKVANAVNKTKMFVSEAAGKIQTAYKTGIVASDEAEKKATENNNKQTKHHQTHLKQLNQTAQATEEANQERTASIARMGQKVLEGYAKEINDTTEHFKQLKDKYKDNQQTLEQLKKEEAAALTTINQKFRDEDSKKLDEYQAELLKISKAAGKNAKDLALQQLEDEYTAKAIVIDKEIADAEARKVATTDTLAKSAEDALIARAKNIKANLQAKKGNDQSDVNESFNQQNKQDDLQTGIDQAQDGGQNIKALQLQKQLLDAQHTVAVAAATKTNGEVAKIEAQYAKKKADLENKLVASKIHAGDKLIDAVLKNTKKDSAIYKAAFLAKKATSIADTIISTKQSIMESLKAYSGIPFIGQALGIAQAAFMAVQGATSIAEIAKQKPGLARGGQFISDGRGAVLPGYSRTDNTNAYLRSGEAVVVSEAMRNPWARNLVSAINVAHGGRDFSVPNAGRGYAIGGIFTDGGNANRYYSQPVNDQKDLANTLAYQMLNNFPPIYVDVKDVNNQQNILAQTVDRVNL